MDPLHRYLEDLSSATDASARRAHDPVRFVHRYDRRDDQELAGLIAVSYAFGRVSLFLPVLDRLFDVLDTLGGPAAAVRARPDDWPDRLAEVSYRWIRPADLAAWLSGLGQVLDDRPSLESIFDGTAPTKDRLGRAVDALRAATEQATGLPTAEWPRGLRYLLPSPTSGSACKRWNLWLRWMVRPADGIDVGLWTALEPSELIIPLDVHVGRVARFLGLTQRTDASWRTAEEVTASLRRFDPDDPVRFDFALAHLGISGACLGHRHAQTCAACPLTEVCVAPAA